MNGSQSLTYTVDTLPVGTTINLQYAVDIDPLLAAGQEIDNVAQITFYSNKPGVPADSNGDGLNDERTYVGPTDSVTLLAPVAEIFKEAELNGELTIGASMVYTLTVPSYAIDAVVYNAVITDVIDSSLEVVGVTNGSFTGNVVTATFATIPANTQEVIVIQTIVPTDTAGLDNTLVLNQATLDYDYGADELSNIVGRDAAHSSLDGSVNCG